MSEAFPGALKLGAEVDAGSKVLDLAEAPLWAQVLQFTALSFRDEVIEARAEEQFRALESNIRSSLTNPNIGYLLEVSIYTNEFGHPVVPGGQLLLVIGPGVEPLDAYAEHF